MFQIFVRRRNGAEGYLSFKHHHFVQFPPVASSMAMRLTAQSALEVRYGAPDLAHARMFLQIITFFRAGFLCRVRLETHTELSLFSGA